MLVDLQNHAAAPAAVAAVGAARGHVLLPVEGHRAVAAAARLDGDAGGIYKGCCHKTSCHRVARPIGAALAAARSLRPDKISPERESVRG